MQQPTFTEASTRAVSYTHLDVYKRQEYYRTGYDAINQLTGGKLGEVVNAVGAKMEAVKSKFGEAFGNVKNTVMTIFEMCIRDRYGSIRNSKLSEVTYFTCLKTLSEAVAKLPLDVYKRQMFQLITC